MFVSYGGPSSYNERATECSSLTTVPTNHTARIRRIASGTRMRRFSTPAPSLDVIQDQTRYFIALKKRT
jgi:hypothetical protein